MKKSILILLVIGACILFLAGCSGAEATNENAYDEIVVGDALTGDGGMTIEEVQEIVGVDPADQTSSEVAAGGETMKTDQYTWIDGIGKGFSVVFTNGHASAKVEVGQ